jgi:hypothetical protein
MHNLLLKAAAYARAFGLVHEGHAARSDFIGQQDEHAEARYSLVYTS